MNWLCFLIKPSSHPPPPLQILSPVIITVCTVAPNPGSQVPNGNTFFLFNLANESNKNQKTLYDCCFPPHHIWEEALWYVKLYVSKQRRAAFCYLTAVKHPLDEPLCQTPLQGTVFVRAWAKATTCNPLLSLLAFFFFLHLKNHSSAYCTSLQLDLNKT